MRHENAVFHGLLKLIPWPVFKELVTKHEMDIGVRGLTTKAQFIAMLFAQFAGSASLRDLVAALESHPGMLYHAGGKPVRRSTLADANRDRSHVFFDELFAAVLARGQVGLPRKMRQAVRLIDSTSLRLSSLSSAWARFSKDVFGAKLHVVYALDEERPVYFAVTPANVNDITPAKSIAIESAASYVFDLGYYDFDWWAMLDAQGCRIVTRFKSNTPLKAVAENAVAKDQDFILSDRIGHLPCRLTYSRKNPMQDPVREIRIRIETGKILRLLTNDLDAPRPGDRRPLQIALADRALLPLDQADAQGQALPRHLRECRAYPGRRRTHRLLAPAYRANLLRIRRHATGVCQARSRLADPPALHRRPPRPAKTKSSKQRSNHHGIHAMLNRTAVAQGRP